MVIEYVEIEQKGFHIVCRADQHPLMRTHGIFSLDFWMDIFIPLYNGPSRPSFSYKLMSLSGLRQIDFPATAPCNMLFGSRSATWEFPEKSVGRICTINIRGTLCWEALGPAGDAMKELYPRIKELLENNQEILERGEDKPRVIGFNLWMVGKSPSTSHPVIVFSSKSWRQRSQAKELLIRSGLLNGYPGINIKTLDRMPAIYRTPGHEQEQGRIYPRSEYILTTPEDPFVYIHRHHDVACGAFISFGNVIPATLAGIVSIGGICYGLTAQHGRFKSQETLRFVAGSDEILAFDEDSDDGSYQDARIINTGKITLYGPSYKVADLRGEANEPNPSIEFNTARPSIRHNDRTLQRTQAAWHPTNSSIALQSESSLRSFNQESELETPGSHDTRALEPGIMIAEVFENSPPNDLDYELLRLYNVERKVNCIAIPGIGGSRIIYPQLIATAAAECEVLAATGTTGTVRGTMISNAYYIRLEYSSTYQELWAVRLERETSTLASAFFGIGLADNVS